MDETDIDLELLRELEKENRPKKIYTTRILDMALHLKQEKGLSMQMIALYLERKEGLKINTTYLSYILKKHALKTPKKNTKNEENTKNQSLGGETQKTYENDQKEKNKTQKTVQNKEEKNLPTKNEDVEQKELKEELRGTEFILQNTSLPEHISDELYESVRTMPREDYRNLSDEKSYFVGLLVQKYLIDKDEAEKEAKEKADAIAHAEKMRKWEAEMEAKEKAEKEKRENEKR